MTGREVAAVLDTSAILGYARSNPAVGELVTLMGEEGRVVGLPILALIEAYAEAADEEHPWLDLLASRVAGVEVFDVAVEHAAYVGVGARDTTMGISHTVDLSGLHNAWIITAERGKVSKLVQNDDIIIDC